MSNMTREMSRFCLEMLPLIRDVKINYKIGHNHKLGISPSHSDRESKIINYSIDQTSHTSQGQLLTHQDYNSERT